MFCHIGKQSCEVVDGVAELSVEVMSVDNARVGAPVLDDVGYDVVVVGGGTAGLSAALTLARARRAVAVVDAGQPRNAPAAQLHNYLSRTVPRRRTCSQLGGTRSPATAGRS